jgi:hypothetical protein
LINGEALCLACRVTILGFLFSSPGLTQNRVTGAQGSLAGAEPNSLPRSRRSDYQPQGI